MSTSSGSRSTSVYLVGVAGGSGSGKTTFAKDLLKRLSPGQCALVYQDNYYIDQSARFDHDGGSVNFDHPDAIDFKLLADHLAALKRGEAAEIPTYDFATHRRLKETIHQPARKIILVDGILIFHSEPVRALLDELIFFDAPEKLRFERRLKRDVEERGRTPDGVQAQFLTHVKPMHDQFVEPSKKFATSIVQDSGAYDLVLTEFIKKLK